MSRQSLADATEKSLAQVIGMVVIIAILMTLFIYYFLKNEDEYINVALNTAVSTFSSQVLTIHSQWLMTHKPKHIVLVTKDAEMNERSIPVNNLGWPDVKEHQIPCRAIWQQVMNQPLKILNYPVSVIEIKSLKENHQINGKICRYFLSDTIYFEYNSDNGKVTKSN